MSYNRRTTAKHGETFDVGQDVWFRGSNEGPFKVVAARLIPEGRDEWGEYPREGVGHHQHVTIDEHGRPDATYSGAWLSSRPASEVAAA